MNPRTMSFMVKISTILVAMFGIIICAFWYPFSLSLSITGPVNSPLTFVQKVEFYSQLIFFWIASIPCFVILLYAWRFGNAINRDEVFCIRTVSIINKCIIILFSDLALFVVGNIVFAVLGWNDFALVYFGIAVVGVIIACILAIAAHYLSRAAALQEEVDCTI